MIANESVVIITHCPVRLADGWRCVVTGLRHDMLLCTSVQQTGRSQA